MFRNWVPYFFERPDAAGSGGGGGDDRGGQDANRGADKHESTDDDQPGDGSDRGDDGNDSVDDEDEPGGGSRVDDDVDDDSDDEDLATATPEDRAKRYRTRARRAQRQVRALRPIADRFRDTATGRFLDARQLDQMVGRARDMEEFETLLDEHPDLVQEILKRKKGGRAAAAEPADEAFVDPFADESQLPWDMTQPGAKALVDHLRRQARENHDLRQSLKKIEGGITQLGQRESQRTVAQHETAWRNETRRVLDQVPEYSRQTFVNAVHRAFELAKTRGTLGRLKAADIIGRELAPFAKHAKQQRRTAAAGAQHRAENNNNRPGPSRGRTAPVDANTRNEQQTGTIKDGRKSFFARLGMSTPR